MQEERAVPSPTEAVASSPGTRTVSAAPVPQVGLPNLGGDVVHDTSLVAFLVSQTLLDREERRKEMEQEQEDLEELYSQ